MNNLQFLKHIYVQFKINFFQIIFSASIFFQGKKCMQHDAILRKFLNFLQYTLQRTYSDIMLIFSPLFYFPF